MDRALVGPAVQSAMSETRRTLLVQVVHWNDSRVRLSTNPYARLDH